MLVPQLVPAPQQRERRPRDEGKERRCHAEAAQRMDVRNAEEAEAEAVDHVEERVEMRQPLPERRQGVNRVEHTGQERERHDQEILKGSDLVDLLGTDASHHAERTQHGASTEGEEEYPQRMAELHCDK